MTESRDTTRTAQLRLDSARKLMQADQPEAAIRKSAGALPCSDWSQLVSAHSLIGLCYFALGEFARAEESQRASLTIAREHGDAGREAAALGNIGDVYKARGEVDKALDYYQQALGVYQRADYRFGMTTQLGRIAAVCRAKHDPEQAVKYYLGALGVHTGDEPFIEHSPFWAELSQLYVEIGRERFFSVCLDYRLTRRAAEALAARVERRG